MLERALRQLQDCIKYAARLLGQKAYNAREGIETPIVYLPLQMLNIAGQKAYNAREGIETCT